MNNQEILFILSIHVSILIAATGCSGPLQSDRVLPWGGHAPLNALIRDIPWLRHQPTQFENATLACFLLQPGHLALHLSVEETPGRRSMPPTIPSWSSKLSPFLFWTALYLLWPGVLPASLRLS